MYAYIIVFLFYLSLGLENASQFLENTLVSFI